MVVESFSLYFRNTYFKNSPKNFDFIGYQVKEIRDDY